MEKKNFPEKGNQPLSNRALAPLLTRACGGLLWKENDTEFKNRNFRACRRSFASWPPGARALTSYIRRRLVCSASAGVVRVYRKFGISQRGLTWPAAKETFSSPRNARDTLGGKNNQPS